MWNDILFPKSDELEKELRRLVTELIPESNYEKTRKEEVENVIEQVKLASPWKIDRVRYAGSIGKHTEVMCADFDVVLFLNDKSPNIGEVLKEWERILENQKDIPIVKDRFTRSDICLQFSLESTTGNVAVDLLPAYNFVNRKTFAHSRRKRCIELQGENVMEIMDKENHSRYSSSLSEFQVGFIKQQNEFTHQVIRLAKFWFKTLYLGRNIYGLKTAVEVIAVSVAKAEFTRYSKKRTKKSKLCRAFEEFLEQVMKIDKLRLAFKKIDGIWTQVQDHQIPEPKPDGVYFIIEPTNIYNDLTKEFKKRKEEVEILKHTASVTSRRLHYARYVEKNGPFDIFRPVLKICEKFASVLPAGFACDYLESYNKYDCTCKKTPKSFPEEAHEISMVIEITLSISVRVAASGILKPGEYESKSGIDELVEVTQKMITEDIMGGEDPKKYMANIKHEKCDVTYFVPFCKYLGTGCLRVSFKWG